MSEREICYLYRVARNQNTQLQVLAELNDTDQNEIIRILVKNGEKIPERAVNKLYKKLNVIDKKIAKLGQQYKENINESYKRLVLNEQITELEKEYREIVRALSGCKNEV